MHDRIVTARLTLSPFAPEDLDELHAIFRDTDVRRYLLDDNVMSRDFVAGEIAASRQRFEDGRLGLWSLRLQDAQAIIGFAGFLPVRGVMQLMYALLPQYWHRGLATEAAQAAVDAAKALGREEVVAATDVPNLASQKVLQRLGFTETTRDEKLIAYEKRL